MKDEMETDDKQAPKGSAPNSSLLEAFDLLRAPKHDAKVAGGAKIVSMLKSKENEKNLQYVLKRLIRSLGANVPEMRLGYYSTLVAILTQFDEINIPRVLEILKNEYHTSGASKSEKGDLALGKILVCGAIFRSGLMLKGSEEEQETIITMLMKSSTKKSYLSTAAYVVLLDFVNGLNEDQFSSIVWSNIKNEFKKEIKEHSLDSLYFLMVVSQKYPTKIKLRKLLGVPEIICEDTIHTICEKIMSGIDLNSVNHPIYNEIGKEIANSPHLHLFWTSGIDSQLIKHKRNKELVALNILISILNNMKENHEVIPELLSKNFFKLFMDWFKGLQTASKIRTKRDDEDDHKIVIQKEKELLNALAKALKSDKVDSKIRVITLTKLLFNPGEMNFTETTGTNIVKSIIADLDADGVKKMAKLFKGVLVNSSKKLIKDGVERPWYNNERQKAAEMISYLVNHDLIKQDTSFKLSYMSILMCFGFFKIGGDKNAAISTELCNSIKTSFYRCFSARFSSVESLVQVLRSLCEFINTTLSIESTRTKLEKQFPKENVECWELLTSVCKTIEANETKSKIDNVFLILLYQLGLFLFSEPDHVKMAQSSIKELKSCYEHYKKGNKKNEDDDPEWIEVVVEVLLSILSTESSVLRSVVQCVFRLLWEYLTPSSIGQIVSVLDPDSDTNPLTQDSDSEADSDDEGEKDENEKDNGKDTDEEKDGEDGEDSETEEEEDDEDMKIPEQLRLAVQKALGAAAPESDAESIDADMIDEEEGKKLDEALAEAFKQFQQGKGKKTKKDRKDKKSLSDFRIRVLDLIDIYLEKDPAMDICLGMIAPLMRCLEFCIQDSQFAELENRVRKTIKNLTKIRKFSSTDEVTVDVLCDYLKTTVDKGTKSHFVFQAMGDVITHFATFIIHCSQRVASTNTPKKGKSASPLLQVLKDCLHSYFHNRSCLLPIIFFHGILQMEWSENYELVPLIVESVFDVSVRQFRRSEGLELVAGFYRSLKRTKPTSETELKKLTNIELSFESTLKETLTGTEFTAKNNFIVTLKKLINTMKGFHESSHIKSSLDFKALLDIVGSFKGIMKSNNNTNQATQVKLENGNAKKHKKKKRKLDKSAETQPEKKKAKVDTSSDRE